MTSSALARRLVEPAFSHVPAYVETFGPEVADLGAMAGFPPDPEQEIGLDALFAIQAGGLSAVYEFVAVCARQNLKTGLFKLAALGWLFITDQRLIVWSAHEFSTTKEAFEDLVLLIEGTSALRKRLAAGPSHGIYRGSQDMSIRLATGQRVKFKARTNSGGRGLSGDKVILDEGMFLRPTHMSSLVPTLSARPDPQLVIGSSAGLAESAVLRGMRDRGRLGLSPKQAYLEWCAPEKPCLDPECHHAVGTGGCVLDDRDMWALANPALGRRIRVETIEGERQALPPEEFARERLGWWDDPAAAGPFPAGVWQGRAEIDIDPHTGLASSRIAGPVQVALDVSWDRRSCALAVAGLRADGKAQGEIVDDDTPLTLAMLAARAAEVAKRHGAPGVWLEPSSAAGSLIPALRKLGVKVLDVSSAQAKQACGAVYDAVMDGSVVHLGQAPLDKAVGAAQRRPTGDAWRWDRKRGADISALYAWTFAVFAAMTTKPRQERRVTVLS